ncbi:hypothetical protein VNO77_27178 [Canavalia gladiata]|uniref:Uncharacterized protein n=1 Tax=Canavalia gladiata TaxID=3824 RepID=A0AAN9Q688_CANGL
MRRPMLHIFRISFNFAKGSWAAESRTVERLSIYKLTEGPEFCHDSSENYKLSLATSVWGTKSNQVGKNFQDYERKDLWFALYEQKRGSWVSTMTRFRRALCLVSLLNV